jgi:hypothetical protein
MSTILTLVIYDKYAKSTIPFFRLIYRVEYMFGVRNI